MIKLNKINKYYLTGIEKQHVLKNIDITINEGEFLAIVGASGAGKSTLIKILGLLDLKFEGEYKYNGVNIHEYTDDQLSLLRNTDIGFIFQNFNLIRLLTVKENIELPILYNKNGNTNKIDEILKKLNIEQQINKYPSELSGGQQQRVAIARALINNPKIIIADEPTGALDSKTAKEVMKIFNKLNKEDNIAIIFITHDINIAKSAKKIIEISDGRIIREDYRGL